jgi:hypothetical protein
MPYSKSQSLCAYFDDDLPSQANHTHDISGISVHLYVQAEMAEGCRKLGH